MDDRPKALLQTLEAFINAETWDESRRIYDAHPEILSDEADAALSRCASQQVIDEARIRTERCRALLERCREVGPDAAFSELTGAVGVPAEYVDAIRATLAAKEQYESTGAGGSLDEAIAAWERILQHPDFPASPERFRLGVFNNAGNTFLARYSAGGALEDLDRALALWRMSLPLIPPGSPDRPRTLVGLTSALYARYKHLGDPADLEQGIEACQEAVQEARQYALELPACLANLGRFLLERHKGLGDDEDLEESIRVLERALSQCAPGTPYGPAILSHLGSSLRARYDHAGDPHDLERAIEIFQSVVEQKSVDARDLGRDLANLGSALNERYNARGDPADLDSAIGFLQEAVRRTPPASTDRPADLTGLGLALGDRYDREGRIEDCEGAIEAFTRAVDATPPGSPDLVGYLNNLAGQLSDHYARTGTFRDLEQAIQHLRQAIQLLPAGSRELPGSYVNLGRCLRDLYAAVGQPQYLEEAIDAFRRASQGTPPGSPNLVVSLNALGVGLSLRYDRSGQLEDLDESLSAFERAVSCTDAKSPAFPNYLNNLGGGLLSRYRHTESSQDLDGAIDAFQRAVDRTQRGSRDLATYLNHLACAIVDRYHVTSQIRDLLRAIVLCRQAVRLTPSTAPELSLIVNNLGNFLRDRYRHSGRLRDLDQAIRTYRRAVKHSLANSPELPKHLNNLAVVLQDRYLNTKDACDLKEAVSAFERSCNRGLEVGLEVVLRTASNWGDWASQRDAWQEAAHAYRFGFEAMDRLLGAQLLRPAKEAWLRRAQHPTRLAYAWARAGDGKAAIEALEAGRTRLLGEALEQNRRDLEQLPGLGHPDLYDRYREAAQRVQVLQMGHGPAGQVTGPARGALRFSAGVNREAQETARAQLHAVIETIRTVPGYTDFYRAPAFATIHQAVPSQSVLVYVVAAPQGGLALALPGADPLSDCRAADCVKIVRLDALTDVAAAQIVVDYLNPYWRWRNERSEPAAMAWYAALEDIAARLGEALAPLARQLESWRTPPAGAEHDGEAILSLILVPTGLLGMLPLHAASYKTNGEPRTLLDEVVVAYAPSAQALAFARSHVGERARQEGRLLAVVNPAGDLPFARREGEALLTCFGAHLAQVLEGSAATQEALVKHLREGNYLHFACHGSYDPLDVLRSGLALEGKNRLELRKILEPDFDLSATYLVTLSACETGMIEFQKVPDEAVGLPTGFLQAGAPAVVSSLWSVNDLSTALLMERFYRGHLEEGLRPALALRHAQLWLRDATAGDLNLAERWAEVCRTTTDPEARRRAFAAMRYFARNPEDKPFSSPYYWAPFTFTGV
jgi:CHAT domain-containing protein/tetratricopeptide (TPR) repeat protein